MWVIFDKVFCVSCIWELDGDVEVFVYSLFEKFLGDGECEFIE